MPAAETSGSKPPEARVHGTCVLFESGGLLLRGPSGAGKSDLALRLIDAGGRLVADDQVLLAAEGGRLVGRAPAAIAGRLEVRGLGILRVPSVPAAAVGLVVDLVSREKIERLPVPRSVELVAIVVPLLTLAPFEVSAVAKLRLAVRGIAEDIGTPNSP